MKALLKIEPQYIIDKKGKKLSVVISIEQYKKMLEDMEEMEDVQLYDTVKARKEKSIPFIQYLQHR